MSESSRKILSDHNVSITNPRILVLEALMESRNPQTIDDLQKKLENKVAKSTLYRVLGDLKKINVLNEFTSPDNTTVVELLLHDAEHHHHLFCGDCGEIIDVGLSDEFEKLLSEEIKKLKESLIFISMITESKCLVRVPISVLIANKFKRLKLSNLRSTA